MLILTEEFVGPDLRELRSFVSGYLRRDFQAFRESFERLRTTATELGRCLDVVQRLALASPGVGFVATHDGRRLFDVEPGMDLRARVRRRVGADRVPRELRAARPRW